MQGGYAFSILMSLAIPFSTRTNLSQKSRSQYPFISPKGFDKYIPKIKGALITTTITGHCPKLCRNYEPGGYGYEQSKFQAPCVRKQGSSN